MTRMSYRLAFPSFIADALRATDAHFLITGGGGWIGRAVLEMLEGVFGDALPLRVSVFGSSDKELVLRSGRRIASRALSRLIEIDRQPVYAVHCAFVTRDKLADQSVENFIAANRAITQQVAEALARVELRGLFMPSSGAVYKKGTHDIDTDLTANPYGVLKHEDERIFVELAAAQKAPVCIPRLFNLSGPFINKLEVYALASMIKAVLAGQPITLRAAHRVVRSYLYVGDLVSLAFAMMLMPKPSNAAVLDTAGDEVVEVGALAERVRALLGRPDLPIQRPVRDAMAPADDVYVGQGDVLRRTAQNYRLTLAGLNEQIRTTADYIRNL